jgi:hypothetical protein
MADIVSSRSPYGAGARFPWAPFSRPDEALLDLGYDRDQILELKLAEVVK